MRNLDEQIQILSDAGIIDKEAFDKKVDEYKGDSPVLKLVKQNATLLMMVAEKDLTIRGVQEQQATLLMTLAEKGVL
ncbi:MULTISPECIES: hypothetical protein [Bacillus cereus group]|uniref:Uncharacterized protein n=1 Tax=Bacillus thuringiensis serovar andalousiensis TaxID=257985 RepID=A0A6H0TES4_BACTU|nr:MULTISPECIES: hypothetical protein [Bacillus cereus group]MDM5429059.1 hypothetical protein [Bacillus mycoides]QIW19063.1 hypothetical protein EVG22_11515 [Bacillus thuringiensis serovar andalousiensis]